MHGLAEMEEMSEIRDQGKISVDATEPADVSMSQDVQVSVWHCRYQTRCVCVSEQTK